MADTFGVDNDRCRLIFVRSLFTFFGSNIRKGSVFYKIALSNAKLLIYEDNNIEPPFLKSIYILFYFCLDMIIKALLTLAFNCRFYWIPQMHSIYHTYFSINEWDASQLSLLNEYHRNGKLPFATSCYFSLQPPACYPLSLSSTSRARSGQNIWKYRAAPLSTWLESATNERSAYKLDYSFAWMNAFERVNNSFFSFFFICSSYMNDGWVIAHGVEEEERTGRGVEGGRGRVGWRM